MAIRTGRALYEGRHPYARGWLLGIIVWLLGIIFWLLGIIFLAFWNHLLGVAMRTVLAACADMGMCMGMGHVHGHEHARVHGHGPVT